jgi:hypothetical protein
MADRTKENDPELDAITQVIEALKPLEEDARLRVLDYVFRRLGITVRGVATNPPHAIPGSSTPGPTLVTAPPAVQSDIRSLTESKKPKTAGEMAALVAYYLNELAPLTDRKAEIGTDDIRKYFKQANFRLPGAANMTLIHAKNAGYLDVGSGRGQYKLNPVGHNLVVHNLPSRTGPERKARSKHAKQTRRK